MAKTAIAKRSAGTDLTVEDIVGRRQRVQQIFKRLMKDKVHYGIVPGTPKPSLWKPGAEMLCSAFRIAPSFTIDNLSDDQHYEFIVTCTGTHQPTGIILGQGMGSGSSNESKYQWRAAVCDEEFEGAPADERREKWERGGGVIYQVRTSPADQVNTVLKMANKRAHVAMTINVLACSEMFAQDLEDLGEDLTGGRGGGNENRDGGRPTGPQSTGSGGRGATPAQVGMLSKRLGTASIDGRLLCEHFGVASLEALPMGKVDEALAWINNFKG